MRAKREWLLWAVGMTNLSPSRSVEWVFVRLAWVGLFSYSLYLTHPAIIALAEHATNHMPAITRGPVLFAVAVLGAWLFYLAIERHYLKPGPERRARPAQQVAPVAVSR